MREKRRCTNKCWSMRRTSNRRSLADSACLREHLCSQLSLLIQVDASGFEPESSVKQNCSADSTPIARPKLKGARHFEQSGDGNIAEISLARSCADYGSQSVWQVVVPPILFHSVICLETFLSRLCILGYFEPNHTTAAGQFTQVNCPPALLPVRHSPSHCHC